MHPAKKSTKKKKSIFKFLLLSFNSKIVDAIRITLLVAGINPVGILFRHVLRSSDFSSGVNKTLGKIALNASDIVQGELQNDS